MIRIIERCRCLKEEEENLEVDPRELEVRPTKSIKEYMAVMSSDVMATEEISGAWKEEEEVEVDPGESGVRRTKSKPSGTASRGLFRSQLCDSGEEVVGRGERGGWPTFRFLGSLAAERDSDEGVDKGVRSVRSEGLDGWKRGKEVERDSVGLDKVGRGWRELVARCSSKENSCLRTLKPRAHFV